MKINGFRYNLTTTIWLCYNLVVLRESTEREEKTMATITREQAEKRQAMAPQGWTYDWRQYVLFGYHRLYRDIKQPDGSVIRGTVSYSENYRRETNQYGCSWNVRTGTLSPYLHTAKWTETSTPGVWQSYGMGREVRIGTDELAKRDYKKLCNYAAKITDEMILG